MKIIFPLLSELFKASRNRLLEKCEYFNPQISFSPTHLPLYLDHLRNTDLSSQISAMSNLVPRILKLYAHVWDNSFNLLSVEWMLCLICFFLTTVLKVEIELHKIKRLENPNAAIVTVIHCKLASGEWAICCLVLTYPSMRVPLCGRWWGWISFFESSVGHLSLYALCHLFILLWS